MLIDRLISLVYNPTPSRVSQLPLEIHILIAHELAVEPHRGESQSPASAPAHARAALVAYSSVSRALRSITFDQVFKYLYAGHPEDEDEPELEGVGEVLAAARSLKLSCLNDRVLGLLRHTPNLRALVLTGHERDYWSSILQLVLRDLPNISDLHISIELESDYPDLLRALQPQARLRRLCSPGRLVLGAAVNTLFPKLTTLELHGECLRWDDLRHAVQAHSKLKLLTPGVDIDYPSASDIANDPQSLDPSALAEWVQRRRRRRKRATEQLAQSCPSLEGVFWPAVQTPRPEVDTFDVGTGAREPLLWWIERGAQRPIRIIEPRGGA